MLVPSRRPILYCPKLHRMPLHILSHALLLYTPASQFQPFTVSGPLTSDMGAKSFEVDRGFPGRTGELYPAVVHIAHSVRPLQLFKTVSDPQCSHLRRFHAHALVGAVQAAWTDRQHAAVGDRYRTALFLCLQLVSGMHLHLA